MGKSKREKSEAVVADEEAPKAKKVKTEQVEDEQVAADETTENISLSETKDWSQLSYEQKIPFTSVIAKPMASKKLAKRLFKLIRKAAKIDRKALLRIGLKDVQLKIRKGMSFVLRFDSQFSSLRLKAKLV